jgi:SAM-dependent methyltransferase
MAKRRFDLWESGETGGDPGEPISRWMVPHVNHMMLDRWMPDRGRALDAGSGRGVEAVRMARAGRAVTALDMSPELPEGKFARVLELERRFLGTPELLGAGEQIVAVFRKR